MGSVSSTNPGLTNLLQTLSNVDSPLLSSQSAVKAIENSSPADIVKLSTAATQLQEVSAIFGTPSNYPFESPQRKQHFQPARGRSNQCH